MMREERNKTIEASHVPLFSCNLRFTKKSFYSSENDSSHNSTHFWLLQTNQYIDKFFEWILSTLQKIMKMYDYMFTVWKTGLIYIYRILRNLSLILFPQLFYRY